MQKTEPKNQESKTCGNENQWNSKTKYINKIRDYLDKKMSQPTQFALFLVIVLLLIVTVIPEFMVYASMLHYNDTALANMQISASCNLIIAFITLLYVILTGYLVLESREMRKLQTEPKLYLFIETREKDYDITDLFIQNIGMGPAYNIEFEVLSDFIYGVLNIDKDGYALPIPKNLYASKASIVKNGIKYLAPNQKKRIFSTMLLQTKNINLQNNLDNHLEIKITYEDNLRVQKKEEFTLCFYEVPANAIGQINTVERKFLRELEKIKDEIGNVSKKIENLEEKLDHDTIDEKNK